jgi:hypothetical protein
MANEMTLSALASIVNTEAIMEARLAFQQNVNLAGEVRVSDLTGERTAAASFPVFTAPAVSKTAEATDQTTNATVTPTDVVLTVARRICKVLPTDLGFSSAQENMSVILGQAIGNARAKQVDTDICAVWNATAYTYAVGATNSTDISVANILSALLTLEVAEANQKLILCLHPKQWNHIRGDLVLTSATSTATERGSDRSAQGQEVMNSGMLYLPLFGAKLLVTPRVGTGTDTNAMFMGALFNADSVGYAVKNVNAMVGVPDIELQRDASLGATEFVHNYYDSAGIIRPTGVVLIKSQTY